MTVYLWQFFCMTFLALHNYGVKITHDFYVHLREGEGRGTRITFWGKEILSDKKFPKVKVFIFYYSCFFSQFWKWSYCITISMTVSIQAIYMKVLLLSTFCRGYSMYMFPGRILYIHTSFIVTWELFHSSGFFTVNKTYDSNMYFWFFPAQVHKSHY